MIYSMKLYILWNRRLTSGLNKEKWHFCYRALLHLAVFRVAFGPLPEMQGHGFRTLSTTSVTFPLHVLHVLLREPMAVQTLTLVTSLP